jgi:hypothetical protein
MVPPIIAAAMLSDLALLEVVGQDREAEQQAQQVGEDHPLVQHVLSQAGEARTGLEAGEAELVESDDRKTSQRDLQRVAVKQRNAQQGQPEQDEVDRYA